MTEPAQTCPKCDRPTLSGAPFCPFCGAPLACEAKPAAPHAPRAVTLPVRADLQGKCTLIYAGEETLDVRRIGRRIAETVGRPLPDVTRELRASKGFLATGLEAAVAVTLAEKLEMDLQAPVLVIPDDAVPALPDALRMRRVMVNSDGLRCEAYAWDRSEEIDVAWNEVFLISCARLEVQEVSEVRDEPSGSALQRLGRRPPELVTTTRYEFLLDIVLFEPWRRLRLDQNTAAFSLTELRRERDASVSMLTRSATNLDRFASGVPSSRGLSLLASGAPEASWDALTFQNKRDFDAYTRWLMQLVRFGRSIQPQ